MAYGQKNYLEPQGTPPTKYRISQIGCFLVSFSNLLERFGKAKDPIALNRGFREKNVWIDVDDGIKDDLAWSSISKYDPNIVVTRTGVGAPDSNNAIVKFTGVNNPFGTHFCLVADRSKGLIVDSWDGKIKHWNTYGGPKSFAVYEDRTPKAPAPTPAPSAPKDSIVVKAGWGVSHVAKAAGYADYKDSNRWDFLARINGHANHSTFKLHPNQVVKVRGIDPAIKAPVKPAQPTPAPQASNTVNITIQAGWGISHALKAAGYNKQQWESPKEWERHAVLNGSPSGLRLKPNQVIKVYKTPLSLEAPKATVKAEAPAPEKVEPVAPVTPPKEEEEDNKVEVKVLPSNPKAYQDSFVEEDRVYVAQESITVKDLDGLHMDRQLVKGQKVNSGGRFLRKDSEGNDVVYIRTKKSIVDDVWYGVPETALSKGQDPDAYVGPLTDDDEDDSLFDLDMINEAKEMMNNLSGREKLVALIAKIQGLFIRLLQAVKIKKKEK